MCVGGLDQPIVDPFTVAPGGNQTRAPEIREVARNLGLVSFENFDAETDADFVIAHQMNEAQPGAVGKGFEKRLDTKFLVTHWTSTQVWLFA
jgi:hypothetical protein